MEPNAGEQRVMGGPLQQEFMRMLSPEPDPFPFPGWFPCMGHASVSHLLMLPGPTLQSQLIS